MTMVGTPIIKKNYYGLRSSTSSPRKETLLLEGGENGRKSFSTANPSPRGGSGKRLVFSHENFAGNEGGGVQAPLSPNGKRKGEKGH